MQRSRHGRGASSGGAAIGSVIFVLFFLLLITCAPTVVVAAEGDNPAASAAGEGETESASAEVASDDSATVPTLPPLLVVEKLDDPLTGSTSLNRESIRSIPQSNPNITDLAPLLPGVQASDDAYRSHYGGEILPALISISGGKADQNSFLVDGSSSGNLFDPLGADSEAIQSISVPPQGMIPLARLVEVMTVLDHNIPARYGNFSGGVVDVQMRKPGRTFSAGVNYRTTRSNWTWFHLSQENRDELESSGNIKDYPQYDFVKYDAGFDFDVPTSKDSSLLIAYQRSRSDLIYPLLGGDKSQYRQLENYFVKWSHDSDAGESFNISLMATPYESSHFLKETKDSDYTIRNRTLALNAGWSTLLSGTNLEINASFARMDTIRNAPQELWYWAITNSKSWGTDNKYSKEGGYGSLESSQETYRLESHLRSAPITSERLLQEISGGFEVGWISGSSTRRNAAYRYTNPSTISPPADCGDDPYCIANEQYLRFITIYDSYHAETERTEIGGYLEDQLTIGALTLRPGLRCDYETFSENKNLAPRFSSSYDLFGTQLVFGANRYFGELALTNVLREKIPPVRFSQRTNFTPVWKPTTVFAGNRQSDLKTPYVDEFSVGIKRPLPGSTLSFDYVHRKGEDEIARQFGPEIQTDGQKYTIYRFNNNGRSHYESYRFAWEGNWRDTGLLVNIAHEETNTSVERYDDTLDDKTLNRLVYYNGQFLSRDELPRTDYNRNWLGNLILTQRLPLGFDFSNVTRYRGPYSALKLVKSNQVIDGQTVDIYGEVKTPAGWTFDWKLAWRQPIATAEVMLSLEVLNVFNHSNRVGGEEGYYEQGRQIWAGLEGKF